METFEIEPLLDGGILRERSFREKFQKIDWNQYKDKEVFVRGCGSTPIPTWAYMMISAKLATCVSKIQFGEQTQPTMVFDRNGQ